MSSLGADIIHGVDAAVYMTLTKDGYMTLTKDGYMTLTKDGQMD